MDLEIVIPDVKTIGKEEQKNRWADDKDPLDTLTKHKTKSSFDPVIVTPIRS